MARQKTPWRTTLPGGIWSAVNWACYNPETLEPNASTLNGPWARLVRLPTIAPDGRELELLLTPDAALAYAERITQQANRIKGMNREHGNGWAPDSTEYTS
jgi:hypothetical protein